MGVDRAAKEAHEEGMEGDLRVEELSSPFPARLDGGSYFLTLRWVHSNGLPIGEPVAEAFPPTAMPSVLLLCLASCFFSFSSLPVASLSCQTPSSSFPATYRRAAPIHSSGARRRSGQVQRLRCLLALLLVLPTFPPLRRMLFCAPQWPQPTRRIPFP